MWGQTSAGVILGLPLAFFSSALLSALLPVDLLTKVAIVGAIALPLWACTICAAYATPSGKSAWRNMALANLVTGAVLYLLSQAGWYGMPANFFS